jgi:hypothetical protein
VTPRPDLVTRRPASKIIHLGRERYNPSPHEIIHVWLPARREIVREKPIESSVGRKWTKPTSRGKIDEPIHLGHEIDDPTPPPPPTPTHTHPDNHVVVQDGGEDGGGGKESWTWIWLERREGRRGGTKEGGRGGHEEISRE